MANKIAKKIRQNVAKKGKKMWKKKSGAENLKKKIVKLSFPIFQNFFRRKVQITHTKFYDHRSRGSGDTRGGRTHVT